MRLPLFAATALVVLSSLVFTNIASAKNPPLYKGNSFSLYGQNSDVDGITGPGTFRVREGILTVSPKTFHIKKTKIIPTATLIFGTTRSGVVPGSNFIKPTITVNGYNGNSRVSIGAQRLIADVTEFKFSVHTPRGEIPITIHPERVTDWNFALEYAFERGHRETGFVRSVDFKATKFDMEQHVRPNRWVFSGSISIRDLGFILKDLSFIKNLSLDASYDTRVKNLSLGLSPTLFANRTYTFSPQVGYEIGANSIYGAAFFRAGSFVAIPVFMTEDKNPSFILILSVDASILNSIFGHKNTGAKTGH
ncbi:MAG: hypothetical protein V1909_00555 [Candidatus Micrarchaeota archaeon]